MFQHRPKTGLSLDDFAPAGPPGRAKGHARPRQWAATRRRLTTVAYVAGVIRRHRVKIGSCWRRLNAGQIAKAIHVLQAREIAG